MLPNMNPKNMQKIMKQMGIKTEDIIADKVVIEQKEKKIILENPSINITYMQGKKIYSITGDEKEEGKISIEDIEMVAEQTGKTKEQAENALKETNGDIAEAIITLKSNS